MAKWKAKVGDQAYPLDDYWIEVEAEGYLEAFAQVVAQKDEYESIWNLEVIDND